jgi:hypothetical protein
VPVPVTGGGMAKPDVPGRSIAAVTTMGYSDFLLGPPGIGTLVEWVRLHSALKLMVVATLAIAIYARAAQVALGLRAAPNTS